MSSSQIIKGSLIAIIMKLLEENGRMYGYEMTKAVRDNSGGRMNITEAALYPALHKLEAEGLLATETEKVDGRMRKYYSLTRKGKTETKKEVSAMQEALEALKLLLDPKMTYHG